ncbi:MAG: Transcription termination/antitermination protein NusA [Chlamydiia bacterium]|nr:Transcription termination/antitermination protein NusA [Chlamydiia bacterium]MCH9615168.1 Transcription termination/antitermination protein NusA [Chlamydiia bacterium]MCH9628510.1 Transcription termination/antitermination protein NusA [Chlamydiia bacterium]
MNKDLVSIFEYLEREKGIKREIIISAIEEALLVAARKGMQGAGNLDIAIDPKNGEIEVYAEKEVVEDVTIPEEEITIDQAKELGLDCEIGDWIKTPLNPEGLGRIAAQTARQVIAGKLRHAERDVIYEEYRHRVGEIVSGTVKRVIRGGSLIVDLGKVEALLPDRYYPKTERYATGDRIQALLLEVRDTDNGGAEVILSRTHAEMVKALFIQEVPELQDDTIAIEKIVREPGYRTKLAVVTNDQKVDPLGACVGVRGTRVKNIIRELNNEKIDIVPYSEDPVALLENLLNPLEIKKIRMEDGTIFIVVNDEDYPIVIGRKGMNARLNGRLIGMELSVKKMSEYQAELTFEAKQMASDESNENLDEKIDSEGLNAFVLDALVEAGFDTPRKLLAVSPDELSEKASISREMADDILEKIRKK